MSFVLKKKHFKNFYFYFVLFFSGYSIPFFTTEEGLAILFILGLLIFSKTLGRLTRALVLALSVWIGYFILNTLIIKSFHPYFLSTYIVYIFVAWWIISYYKEKIFEKYENAIYILSIVSLVFYSWQILHFDSIYSLIKALDLSEDAAPYKGYASVVIYSITKDTVSFFPQNCGFTWEPGPFSCYVVLAIFFNLARNKMIFKERTKLLVLLITLISTQSTTGVVGLLLIAIWIFYARSKNVYARILVLPIGITLILMIFINVPFLYKKILSESQQDLDVLIEYSILYESSYNPGRFASLQLAWIDFKNHPIVGIGGNSSLRYANQQGANINTISGIGMIMTRYGSFGLILFFILIINAGKWMANFYSYKAYLILPLILLTISFSFRIMEAPVLIALWMSPLFLKKPNFYR